MSRLAIITILGPGGGDIDNALPGAPVYPGNALPGYGGPVDPGYGRPGYGGGRPDNSLPPPGQGVTLPVFPFDPTRPDAGLPVAPVRPDNSLPGGRPERPDNSLPGSGARPDNSLPSVRPGMRFIAKWAACYGLILVPDNSLPGQPTTPDNELPETAEPKY